MAYYLTHTDERKAKIKWRQNNPGELADTPKCKDSRAARLKAMTQGTRNAEDPLNRKNAHDER